MRVSEATRARRREATRTGHQLPAAMANALLWDVILACGDTIPMPGQCYIDGELAWTRRLPVVKFKGHYYLAEGNPYPMIRQRCRLMARPDNPGGDLCITSDGIVATWDDRPGPRWQRNRKIVGVQEDVQPVVSLPVAGAGTIARAIRAGLSGAGASPDDEQLQRGIRRRVPGDHQPELHPKTGA